MGMYTCVCIKYTDPSKCICAYVHIHTGRPAASLPLATLPLLFVENPVLHPEIPYHYTLPPPWNRSPLCSNCFFNKWFSRKIKHVEGDKIRERVCVCVCRGHTCSTTSSFQLPSCAWNGASFLLESANEALPPSPPYCTRLLPGCMKNSALHSADLFLLPFQSNTSICEPCCPSPHTLPPTKGKIKKGCLLAECNTSTRWTDVLFRSSVEERLFLTQ